MGAGWPPARVARLSARGHLLRAMRRGYLQDLVDAGAVVCTRAADPASCDRARSRRRDGAGHHEPQLQGRMGNPTSRCISARRPSPRERDHGRDLGSQGSELTMARANVVSPSVTTSDRHHLSGRYMATVLPTETPQFAFATTRVQPEDQGRGDPEGQRDRGGANLVRVVARSRRPRASRGPSWSSSHAHRAHLLQNAITRPPRRDLPDHRGRGRRRVEVRPDAVVTTRPQSFPSFAAPVGRPSSTPAADSYTRRLMLEPARPVDSIGTDSSSCRGQILKFVRTNSPDCATSLEHEARAFNATRSGGLF